ncbi:MAG: NAD-dependent epimerase/dehydratase family protein [Ilumatobacteraceae bacterium]
MTHALVVGGAGFIGSHLVDRLLADGDAVDVVDDLSSGGLGNLSDARSVGGRLKIHHLDAAAPEFSSLLGMRDIDVLYHLAAVPRGPVDARSLASAFAMTVSILDAARTHRVPKVVVTLPATVLYGRPASRDLPVKEQPLEPRGIRGVVARATVDLLDTYREQSGIEFTALAMSTVFGPRQRADSGVVAAFVDAVRHRRPPRITGDGRQTRDLLFIDDAVDALVRAATRGSGLVINIGTGDQTTLRELWAVVSGASSTEPDFVPARDDEVQRFAVSPVRARIHLSWSPWTTLAEGVALSR